MQGLKNREATGLMPVTVTPGTNSNSHHTSRDKFCASTSARDGSKCSLCVCPSHADRLCNNAAQTTTRIQPVASLGNDVVRCTTVFGCGLIRHPEKGHTAIVDHSTSRAGRQRVPETATHHHPDILLHEVAHAFPIRSKCVLNTIKYALECATPAPNLSKTCKPCYG